MQAFVVKREMMLAEMYGQPHHDSFCVATHPGRQRIQFLVANLVANFLCAARCAAGLAWGGESNPHKARGPKREAKKYGVDDND
jgi:hypothetical protein